MQNRNRNRIGPQGAVGIGQPRRTGSNGSCCQQHPDQDLRADRRRDLGQARKCCEAGAEGGVQLRTQVVHQLGPHTVRIGLEPVQESWHVFRRTARVGECRPIRHGLIQPGGSGQPASGLGPRQRRACHGRPAAGCMNVLTGHAAALGSSRSVKPTIRRLATVRAPEPPARCGRERTRRESVCSRRSPGCGMTKQA